MRLHHDVRDAVRMWRQRPGLTVVAIGTLALASGAAMVCVSLLDAIAFKPLPVDHPEQLVALTAVNANGYAAELPPRLLEALRRNDPSLRGVCGYLGSTRGLPVAVRGERIETVVELVSGSYFDLLHVRPVAGRLLASSDDGTTPASTPRVAVLSERFWRERFGGTASAIGETLTIGGERFTIVGVAPRTFVGMQIEAEPDLVVSAQAVASYFGTPAKPTQYHYVLARIEPHTSIDVARVTLETMWPHLMSEVVVGTPEARTQAVASRPVLTSASTGFSFLRPRYQTSLGLLATLAGWMLLTACVSLASLLVARAIARFPELRTRVALGASRTDLVRQLVVESAMLAIGGTLAGLMLAEWGAPILLGLLWPYVQHMTVDLAPDRRVVEVTTALAMTLTLLLSVPPAWIAVHQARLGLARDGRRMTMSHARWSEGLLVAQLAISLVLVIGAGLFVRTLVNLGDTNLGFDPHGLLGVILEPTPNGHRDQNDEAYYPALLADVASVPGVQSAALMTVDPFLGVARKGTGVAPSAAPEESVAPLAARKEISPTFFATLGVPLTGGREFTWHDSPDTPRAAVLSVSLAARLFPRGDGLGQSIRVGTDTAHRVVMVVGIVPDFRFDDVHAPGPPTVYLATAQEGTLDGSSIVVRTAANTPTVRAEIRRHIEAFGHDDVFRIRPWEDAREVAVMRERLNASLGAGFGALAMFLALIGTNGLMSQLVARRTREFGLRLALGASPRGLGRLVLGRSVRLAVLGVGLGLPCAWAAARVAAANLYGVTPHDPLIFGSAVCVLFAIVMLAAGIPAARSLRLSPMDAMRQE